MSSNNISGYKGVHWNSRDKKWKAVIKGKFLGLFDCKHDAATVYDAAVIEYYGEFGKTNKQIRELCK